MAWIFLQIHEEAMTLYLHFLNLEWRRGLQHAADCSALHGPADEDIGQERGVAGQCGHHACRTSHGDVANHRHQRVCS